jgi:hypothetical protein
MTGWILGDAAVSIFNRSGWNKNMAMQKIWGTPQLSLR